ncbi:alpha/beta fold hydrolase [Nocardia yamanashiensis]|uniref:alpha/beta fold hydrolase n=1 Tax=Nocardia yamanashiensis TaxID=209247 RepID=UPI00082A9044|nr:alpha/beta fold hydrolase [Nocardia yamanashiensis]
MTDLHVREWGTGERIAVLVHGLTTDSTSWWQLGPALAARGYKVIAPDLPGHGHSARAQTYSLEAMAGALAAALPDRPELVIGHSLGALLLAHIVDDVKPDRVVYADPAWSPGHPAMADMFRTQKQWTLEQVRAATPRWAPEAQRGKLESLSRWDTGTLAIMDGFPGFQPVEPPVPSLVLLADPSQVVSPEKAALLGELGYQVRTVANTGHVIHNDDFPGFLAQLHGQI